MLRKTTDKETAQPPISRPADRGQFRLVRTNCPTCPDSALWWGGGGRVNDSLLPRAVTHSGHIDLVHEAPSDHFR